MFKNVREAEKFQGENLDDVRRLKYADGASAVAVFGSFMRRGDFKKGESDVDVLYLIKDEGYFTPNHHYEAILELEPRRDVSVFNVNQLDGVLIWPYGPTSYNYFSSEDEIGFVFGDEKAVKLKFRNGKDRWKNVRNKLDIRESHLSALSQRGDAIRKTYLSLLGLMPFRAKLKNPPLNSLEYQVDKIFNKNLKNIKSNSIFIEALDMNKKLGSYQKNQVIRRFCDNYPEFRQYEDAVLEIRKTELSELSNEELLKVVRESKKLGEAAIHIIDQDLIERANLTSL